MKRCKTQDPHQSGKQQPQSRETGETRGRLQNTTETTRTKQEPTKRRDNDNQDTTKREEGKREGKSTNDAEIEKMTEGAARKTHDGKDGRVRRKKGEGEREQGASQETNHPKSEGNASKERRRKKGKKSTITTLYH